jgi:hypothetical protein
MDVAWVHLREGDAVDTYRERTTGGQCHGHLRLFRYVR